jgi:hypothetical protein
MAASQVNDILAGEFIHKIPQVHHSKYLKSLWMVFHDFSVLISLTTSTSSANGSV